LQDGIASPDDVDTAISWGLGLRHSFMAPFETMRLNVDGVEDYCKKYGANILNILESQSASRSLSGSTLDVIKKQWKERYLNARRKWRDSRLAALAINSKDMASMHRKVRTNMYTVVDLRSFVHNLILTITCLYLCMLLSV